MSIAQTFLPEFDNEFGGLRKTLERVPEGKWDWKPHAKSMTIGQLSGHLAELPEWLNTTMDGDVLDFANFDYKPFLPTSRAELLKKYDEKAANARKALAAATDERFMGPWTMKNGDTVYFTMPRVAVVRSFVMNHMIHHRAQLGVYLRLNEVPVPGMYGPTADEGDM